MGGLGVREAARRRGGVGARRAGVRRAVGAACAGAAAIAVALAGAGCQGEPAVAAGGADAAAPPVDTAMAPVDAARPDAAVIDGPPPDPTPVEGGTVFVEYMRLSDAAATFLGSPTDASGHPTETYATRVVAEFRDYMVPQQLGFGSFTSCTDANNIIANKLWPSDLGEDKVYLDFGDQVSVVGKDETGATHTFVAPRKTNGTDSLGRSHLVFYESYDVPLANSDKADRLLPGSFYNLVLPGTTTALPGKTFTKAIYVPVPFTDIDPALNDDVNFTLSSSSDNPISWQNGNNSTAGILEAEVVATSDGVPVLICAGPPGTTSMTITGAAVQSFVATAGDLGADTSHAFLAHWSFLHNPVPLPNGEPDNPRRIDLVGIYATVQRVSVK